MPKTHMKSRKPVYGISIDIGIVDFLWHTFLELNLSFLPCFTVDFVVDNFVFIDTWLGKKLKILLIKGEL